MDITGYINRHPAFDTQKMDNYEEKLVVNRIKEINRLIGTVYSKAVHRLIRRSTKRKLIERSCRDYAITKEDV